MSQGKKSKRKKKSDSTTVAKARKKRIEKELQRGTVPPECQLCLRNAGTHSMRRIVFDCSDDHSHLRFIATLLRKF